MVCKKLGLRWVPVVDRVGFHGCLGWASHIWASGYHIQSSASAEAKREQSGRLPFSQRLHNVILGGGGGGDSIPFGIDLFHPFILSHFNPLTLSSFILSSHSTIQ